MKVKLEIIRVIDSYYPRDNFDNETVNNYRQNISNLPPIILNQDNILVDGYHRLIAHRVEGLIEIEAEIKEIAEKDIFIEAIRLNSFHGKQLNQKEKKQAAVKLAKDGHDNDKDLQTLLGVGERTIDLWLKDLRQEKRQNRNQEILDLYLAGFNDNEISEKLQISDRQIRNILEEGKKRIIAEISTPESLQLYNVWNFSKCEEKYGLAYPGRIPGQIIENLLYYYTQPFDMVVDPMAGGGTTLDVCKSMFRRCLAYDINTVRPDIQKHDVSLGFNERARNIDFIMLDPPYWRLKRDEYKDESISSGSLNEWFLFMANIAKSSFKALKNGGYLGLIIEAFLDEKETGNFIDLPFACTDIFIKAGYSEVQRIATPMSTQIKNHHSVQYAKDKHLLLDINRDLIVFKKDK